MDGIAPAGDWQAWWKAAVAAKRAAAPWANATEANDTPVESAQP